MFVSRLDRPWIQTKFPIHGVHIKGPKDIERLRTYCSYVFVDVEKGPAPDLRYWMLKDEVVPQVYRSARKNKRSAASETECRSRS